jgi:hypothetical protein
MWSQFWDVTSSVTVWGKVRQSSRFQDPVRHWIRQSSTHALRHVQSLRPAKTARPAALFKLGLSLNAGCGSASRLCSRGNSLVSRLPYLGNLSGRPGVDSWPAALEEVSPSRSYSATHPQRMSSSAWHVELTSVAAPSVKNTWSPTRSLKYKKGLRPWTALVSNVKDKSDPIIGVRWEA